MVLFDKQVAAGFRLTIATELSHCSVLELVSAQFDMYIGNAWIQKQGHQYNQEHLRRLSECFRAFVCKNVVEPRLFGPSASPCQFECIYLCKDLIRVIRHSVSA